MGTSGTGFPAASSAVAMMWVEAEFVIRFGIAFTISLLTLMLPMVTVTLPLTAPPPLGAGGVKAPGGNDGTLAVAVAVPVGAVTVPPPETAVTRAVPDRLS